MYARPQSKMRLHRAALRGRGMGAANCPSLDQLMGNVNPADPCQGGCYDENANPIPCGGAAPGVTIVNPSAPGAVTGVYPAGGGPAANLQCYNSAGAPIACGSSGFNLGSIGSLLPWLIGGVIVIGVLRG